MLGGCGAYFYLIGRPDYADGTYETTVGDTKILVRSDPKRAVTIISTPPVDQGLVGGEGSGGTGGGEVTATRPRCRADAGADASGRADAGPDVVPRRSG